MRHAPFPTLAGQALIAMPSIGDSRFERTVIYMCMHDADGAMGVVVNKPMAGRRLGDVMRELNLLPKGNAQGDGRRLQVPVLQGGPVEPTRGFVLHAPSVVEREGTVAVTDDVHLSTTLDVLRDIAAGAGPGRLVFALGFASWTAGQLDAEILNNAWLHAPMGAGQLFDTPPQLLYAAALSSLGIDLHQLSPVAGRG